MLDLFSLWELNCIVFGIDLIIGHENFYSKGIDSKWCLYNEHCVGNMKKIPLIFII